MLTLVLGGARSGKSRYAQSLCEGDRVVYVATAAPQEDDTEMINRVDRHRRDRPTTWITVEAPLEVPMAISAAPPGYQVLVDCVTVWIANLLAHHARDPDDMRESRILNSAIELAECAQSRDVIAVSNEVGSGLVPMHPVGRQFRDVHGLVNQRLAREAATVILLIAGLPLLLKQRDAAAGQ